MAEEYKEAIPSFEKAIALEPNFIRAFVRLQTLYHITENLKKADLISKKLKYLEEKLSDLKPANSYEKKLLKHDYRD